MSNILKFNVSKQMISCDTSTIVSDTVNVYECYFTFDREWNGYNKIAVFMENNGVSYRVQLDENNHCILPWEAIKDKGNAHIGVYGVKGSSEEGNYQRYPTIWTKAVKVVPGCENGQGCLPPSPDIYQELLKAYRELKDKKQDKLTPGKNITIDENNVISAKDVPYLSCERLDNYIYKVTFDSIPDYIETNDYYSGGCTSFVRDGKLYRNFDWKYDRTAEFRVICKNFEGVGYINGMNDGQLDSEKVGQLPYHVNDGVNKDGIMVSTHVLFNDWSFEGSGNKSKDITLLPYYILTHLHRIDDISSVLRIYLNNIKIPEGLIEAEYLIQFMVTDGETTYAILPPTSTIDEYTVVDISSNPKLTNFRWVDSKIVEREELQNRPTGVERWNSITTNTNLSDLRFTKCYEEPTRLSEFIGIDGTTKDSTDEELSEIYLRAHNKYLNRVRNGELWQTCHSVIMEQMD